VGILHIRCIARDGWWVMAGEWCGRYRIGCQYGKFPNMVMTDLGPIRYLCTVLDASSAVLGPNTVYCGDFQLGTSVRTVLEQVPIWGPDRYLLLPIRVFLVPSV
jgi:hypothetical protein